jgi:hypothetical protein
VLIRKRAFQGLIAINEIQRDYLNKNLDQILLIVVEAVQDREKEIAKLSC